MVVNQSQSDRAFLMSLFGACLFNVLYCNPDSNRKRERGAHVKEEGECYERIFNEINGIKMGRLARLFS